MAYTKDPALTIWRAINILAEVDARLDDAETSGKILEAEKVLLNLMLDLWEHGRKPDAVEQFEQFEQFGYFGRSLH
jgi:hypothetical protein